MNLKQRLKLVESKLNPPIQDDIFIHMTTGFFKGEEKPIIGYQCNGDLIMAIEGETDKDLSTRANAFAKSKGTGKNCCYLLWAIYDRDCIRGLKISDNVSNKL